MLEDRLEKLSFMARRLDAVYRNIATCYPSQDLFDDVAPEKHFSIIQDIENRTSGIRHDLPQNQRVFQYGIIESTLFVFEQPQLWRGRFSDGSYGVWYGALEEQTSIQESIFWLQKFVAPDLDNARDPFTVDRRMFRVVLEHEKTIDLRLSDWSFLTDDDIRKCQELGQEARKRGVGFFLTPSARQTGGTCTPVFTPEAIREERSIYFLRVTFSRNHPPILTRSF